MTFALLFLVFQILALTLSQTPPPVPKTYIMNVTETFTANGQTTQVNLIYNVDAPKSRVLIQTYSSGVIVNAHLQDCLPTITDLNYVPSTSTCQADCWQGTPCNSNTCSECDLENIFAGLPYTKLAGACSYGLLQGNLWEVSFGVRNFVQYCFSVGSPAVPIFVNVTYNGMVVLTTISDFSQVSPPSDLFVVPSYCRGCGSDSKFDWKNKMRTRIL
eukprot:TRINITY_DN2446_c0_g1_i2.p1 TRINITY_DN2446_c0_g1~~TRINITY_DN2446_c0_g1_i2.p1  ORF type:complete len:216 (+),score=25.20 TRINITY_DN2446_c0_g1_i2:45-692(+)